MLKREVRDFWDRESCGEVYARGTSHREALREQARSRYALEPYLAPFARFDTARGTRVLEIGVGMGADHLSFARERPALLAGVDLTARALAHTRERFAEEGFADRLALADAEHLPFGTGSFDSVFSWGVLHHTPDTPAAVSEVWRVLRPGGVARVMLYHRPSITVDVLWLRYALLAGRPWRRRKAIVASHLESPGSQAFTRGEVRAMFAAFSRVSIATQLAFTDLLEGAAGQRHQGPLLDAARRWWPRGLVRRLGGRRGFNLLIEAVK